MEFEVTEQNIMEITKSETPVLLDFWAPWCGPCRMLAPIIEEIAEEYDGKLKVGKVNIDEQPALAAQFGIQVIPTLVVIRDGVIQEVSSGYREKEDVLKLVFN